VKKIMKEGNLLVARIQCRPSIGPQHYPGVLGDEPAWCRLGSITSLCKAGTFGRIAEDRMGIVKSVGHILSDDPAIATIHCLSNLLDEVR
jgi:hypothetical protein